MTTTAEVQTLEEDFFLFAEEEAPAKAAAPETAPWKVLVVDDEEEIHRITEMVLRDITFDNAPLEIISAFSGKDAIEVMKQHQDIAIILLDVVMESDTSGLETVRTIRRVLKNHTTRIILRTGQPGKAPERSVILDYDINDYREKTELTSQKLFTTVVAALRNFRDMQMLEKSRHGLQKVIESSALLFSNHSLRQFSEDILSQLLSILNIGNSSYYLQTSGIAVTDTPDGMTVLAATGDYSNQVNETVPPEIATYVEEALRRKESIFFDNAFVGYFETGHGSRNVLFLSGTKGLNELDIDLIRVFCNNVAIAYENIYLSMDVIDTQKDIIVRMGEVVETRSRETANHVYRVAELSYLLARHIGMNEDDAMILQHASPMHDVGKVGVPDEILLKPGKLTADEFAVMKTHATLGFNIFKNSPREIIKAAATIAHEHHERWDGNGYPRGIKGEEIHIFGRITALVDIFDALAHKRCYKDAWSTDDVFQYIEENRGKIFDPTLVDAFFELKDEVLDILQKFPDV